ncbi:MarR family winged helix-turn-helix transcriptional regulator [Amycolatopsis benzoatilytica]|uniref:MarR family winged helix-turn-helix transcriptional regulator n=1 Tax=Amycolatopsis benzoatilytica TaxID=346045 RepID=UPI00037326A4|nr:MarR family transcriptional regulator [Amycolatopsis benzoatilytica]
MEPDSVGAGLSAWLAAMPGGVEGPVEAARQRIGRLSRQFELVLREVAKEYGFSAGDWQALSALHRSGAAVLTPKELADLLSVTSGTVTVRINRLEQAGLIERVATASDGRSRPIRLTRKGRARWAAATKKRTERERALFADALGEKGLADLNALLALVLSRFESELGPASPHDALRPD